MNRTTNSADEIHMRDRRITLADGRYLIFYTFDNAAYEPKPEAHIVDKIEPRVEPDSVEEPPA